MIKKLLSIIVLGFLLSGNAYADDVKFLPKETTVNSLMQDGYKLIDTDSVTWKEGSERVATVNIHYHLIKGDELVSCTFFYTSPTRCWKP